MTHRTIQQTTTIRQYNKLLQKIKINRIKLSILSIVTPKINKGLELVDYRDIRL